MTYGLIGERLGHSFSKWIHNRLFDYDYQLQELSNEQFHRFMTNREFTAINVTIPYKEAVIPYLDEITDTARAIGAVNTIVNRDGKLYGDNTDFFGMLALLNHVGIDLKNKHVLILGSGGTSKTALAVAKHSRCASVHRVSRTKQEDCLCYEEAATLANTQVIINTTPCGMFPSIGESAIDIAVFPHLSGVVDAIYNPLRSKLVCDALARGIPAVGGLYMLVAQAAVAGERFIGQSVSQDSIDQLYHELLATKQNLVLIGMPGCGKSTVGRLLAQKRGLTFIDTDREIEKQEGCSIPELFSRVGEAGFREIEAAVVRRVSACQGAVIATGGGAILRQENGSLLRENGRLYFLDRPLESLVTTHDRPLSADRSALEQRYRERYDIYRTCCDVHIRSDGTPAQTILQIEEDADHETVGTQRA